MDLRSLQCIVALEEERHFGRAATRLHMTQPAFSQRIAGLEAEVGHRLFERMPGAVVPTAAGAAMIVRARVAVANAEAAKSEARLAAAGLLGRLRVGFTQIVLYQCIPELFADFRMQFPAVEVELVELNSPAQEVALVEGRIDVGLLHPPLAASELALRYVGEIGLTLALPSAWPEAEMGELHLVGCAEMPFLIAPRAIGPHFYDRIIAACHSAGFSPRVVQEATPMSTLIGLAAAGVGAGFVAQCLSVIRRPGAAFVSITGALPTLPVAAAWREDFRNPAVKHFVDLAISRGLVA